MLKVSAIEMCLGAVMLLYLKSYGGIGYPLFFNLLVEVLILIMDVGDEAVNFNVKALDLFLHLLYLEALVHSKLTSRLGPEFLSNVFSRLTQEIEV